MPRQMALNAEALYKSLILLGFSIMLFWLVGSGKIFVYINPRFTKLTEVTAAVMFLMFLVQASQLYRRLPAANGHYHGQGKIKWTILPFAVPLLMVFLLPNNALNANLALNKGMNRSTRTVTSTQSGTSTVAPNNAPTTQLPDNNTNTPEYNQPSAGLNDKNTNSQDDKPSAQLSENLDTREYNPISEIISEIRESSLIKVTDENFTLVINQAHIYPEEFAGKEITMLGFVFKDPELEPGQFGLVRYVMTCCSADAVPDGFICEYKDGENFKEGSWFNIKGVIRLRRFENNSTPVIEVTSFSKAQEPQNPYIYPIY